MEQSTTTPAFDVFEGADDYLILADVPGVSREALDLSIEGPVVTVQGTASGASYERRFTVPEDVEPTAISAELKNGVLSLRLGKSQATKPRQIPVSVS